MQCQRLSPFRAYLLLWDDTMIPLDLSAQTDDEKTVYAAKLLSAHEKLVIRHRNLCHITDHMDETVRLIPKSVIGLLIDVDDLIREI